MANDTPRYGSRNDDEARRYSDDAETTDEQRTRPSFLESSYADEPEVTDRSSYSSDPYERRTGTQSGRRGSLEGLRPSRYDNDDTAAPARDTFSSSPLRDNGPERTDAPTDIDRFKPSTSSFGTQDSGQRNPLLKPNTAMRRFSWEEDDTPKPAERTAAPLRDYEPSRYESRNPRLDEMSPEPEAPSYGSDRNSDARHRTPAPGYSSRAQAPDAAAERQYGNGDNYASTPYADAPYDDAPRDYDAYDDTPYQGAHARELADVDQEYAREYQYNADAAEPRHAYGDYDPEFQHYEQPYGEYQQPRRRRGPFLLVGSLVGVAVIAGGLIFAYQALQGGDEKTIPVVTVDETPIKVEPQAPQPQVQEQPRKTKLIYDRIRAEGTETESTLVPREEEPAIPTNQEQSNTDLETGTEQLTATPTAEAPQLNTDGTEPLPLPLPPPPVNNAQETQTIQPTFNTTTQNLNTGGEVIVPTQDTATNDPPAPATQETATPATPATPDEPAPSDAIARLIESPPLPREKPTPPSRQADPGPAVPTGPIQIAPLPGSVDRETTTAEQNTPDQNPPTQLQPAAPVAEQTPTQEQPRRRTSRFSDELDTGTRINTTQQDTQIALAPQPDSPTPDQTQPQTPITGGNYMIQTASFRSEAEAQAGFQELQSRHPSLLGTYTSLIQQADLGTRGTYYRLRIGPIETRTQASQLCNSLIAAGERDCVVRERR